MLKIAQQKINKNMHPMYRSQVGQQLQCRADRPCDMRGFKAHKTGENCPTIGKNAENVHRNIVMQ